MAGEPILIVDDTPVNLKLTRILLINEGYTVKTAGSAEEALELLQTYHPHLLLADIQLPGIDGLELTRRIKADPATNDITVVALTAFAMKGDEQRALDAGCEGYITKPIDTRALGARVRAHLDKRTEMLGHPPAPPVEAPAVPAEPPEPATIPEAEMQMLRKRFLDEGQERARQLLLDLDTNFNGNEAGKQVHNWIGTGGLLGYTAISRLAREVEAVLLERPLENTELREALTNLALAFNSPREARDAPISETIVQALAGKRVALIGLRTTDAQRMCVALERTQSIPVFFEAAQQPRSQAVLDCDVAAVYVHTDQNGSKWLDPAAVPQRPPIVFVGERDHIVGLDQSIQAIASEYLMDAWQPEEALVRLSLALSRRRADAPPQRDTNGALTGRAQVVIADDDPMVVTLLRTALENFGMECQTADNGPAALELIRKQNPHAAILDVNMPGMDGYEVLAAVRGDKIPVKVLLLTARQQESDVLRGFTLGADDYVVKPFSPMELVARVKRLLWR